MYVALGDLVFVILGDQRLVQVQLPESLIRQLMFGDLDPLLTLSAHAGGKSQELLYMVGQEAVYQMELHCPHCRLLSEM